RQHEGVVDPVLEEAFGPLAAEAEGHMRAVCRQPGPGHEREGGSRHTPRPPVARARLRLRFTLTLDRSDDPPMFGPPRLATIAVTLTTRRFRSRRRPARVSGSFTSLPLPAATENRPRAITTALDAA